VQLLALPLLLLAPLLLLPPLLLLLLLSPPLLLLPEAAEPELPQPASNNMIGAHSRRDKTVARDAAENGMLAMRM
jgi:hypothetical protein